MASGSEKREIAINDLSEIDDLEASEEQQVLNRFLRAKATEIIAVVGQSMMASSGYLDSATQGDHDPIKV